MTAVAGRVRPRLALRGLYAITPDAGEDVDDASLAAAVDAALRGGAVAVQYRDKRAAPDRRRTRAEALAAVCRRHRRPLIVNDHEALATSIDGAGLHVGSDDCDDDALAALRDRLGPDRILGVSCYRSVDRARAAVAAGADYVAFGSLFPSTTKPHAPPAPLGLFREARDLGVPLVGIGGITRGNVASLVAAGCDATAVIGDLFGGDAAEVESRARAFAAAFGGTR